MLCIINSGLLLVTMVFAMLWAVPLPPELLSSYYFYLGAAAAVLMIVLPLWMLELAMAVRSKELPLKGFVKLTRESDSARGWRIIPWVSLVTVVGLSAYLLYVASTQILATLPIILPSAYTIGFFALLAVIISGLHRFSLQIVLVLATILIAAVVVSELLFPAMPAQTAMSVDALFAVLEGMRAGLLFSMIGLGLYWTSAVSNVKRVAGYYALLTLIVITVFGGFFAWVGGLQAGGLLLSGIAVCASMALLSLSRLWLNNAAFSWVRTSGLLVLLLAGWLLVMPWVSAYMLQLLQGMVVVLTAIYAGWQMKISHLRKTIGFGSELWYNLFRVVMRLLIPALCVALLVI